MHPIAFDPIAHRLIAILRGVTPDAVVPLAQALYEAGMRCVEVPMNSPQPLQSVERLAAAMPPDCWVGVGTVLNVAQVDTAHAAGARVVISPDSHAAVIERTKALGLLSLPGVTTPTEAFAALRAGADGLKVFPYEVVGLAGIKAFRAILPRQVPVLVVGGVTPQIVQEQAALGELIQGWGLGSALYRPGDGVAEVKARALAFVLAAQVRS